MKKLILILIGIAFAINVNATHNPFKKSKERAEQKQKMLLKKPYQNNVLVNINVPTLIKNSSWDMNMNTWTPNNATKNIYQNDLVTTTYDLSYSLSDTMSRTSYTYNSDKRMTTALSEYRAMPGVFIPNFRYTFTYSNNYKKEVVLEEMYDQQTQTWTPSSRYIYEFNDRGVNTKYVYETYSNGQWEIFYGYSSLISYLNNNSDKYLEFVDSSYNSTTQTFEPQYREVRVYNPSEEVVHITYYESDNVSLKIKYRDSVTYVSGVPTELLEYEYDEMSATYTISYKLHNLVWANFDPSIDLFNNQPLGYLLSLWDGQNWQIAGRYSITSLDSYGSIVSLEENYNNNAWVPSYRTTEKYDSKYNNTEYTDEEYDDLSSIWNIQYSVKYLFQYDMSDNPTEKIITYFDNINNSYVNQTKTEYFNYISIAAGMNTNTNTIETKLFPNPSNDGRVSVNVKMEKESVLNIKVIDLKGSIVYTQSENLGSGLNTIQLQNLKQGLYVVELSTDFGLSRTKLIVN